MSLDPVLLVRHKDSRPKPTSRYASGSVTNGAKKKRKKTPNKVKPTHQHVMVLGATGKIRWIWREI
jgi:hypothetical protein